MVHGYALFHESDEGSQVSRNACLDSPRADGLGRGGGAWRAFDSRRGAEVARIRLVDELGSIFAHRHSPLGLDVLVARGIVLLEPLAAKLASGLDLPAENI